MLSRKDVFGNTLVMLAVKLSHLSKHYFQIVKFLLLFNPDSWTPDFNGFLPLEIAVFQSNKLIITAILDHYIKRRKELISDLLGILSITLESEPDFILEYE